MVKIQSQSGNSLADVYDAEGSIAGIETLETHELPIVHEMGATVFSERLGGFISRGTTGAILQTITWDVVLTNVGLIPSRLLGVVVFADDGSRVSHATVSIRDPLAEREVPIFVHDSAEKIIIARLDDNGTIGPVELLQNQMPNGIPSMLIGTEQEQPVDQIAFRGLSTTFGAGDVTVTMMLYRAEAQAQAGGISSRGLPIPGW